jgi:hypothetical protein
VDGDDETPADRLIQAFEMFEFGVEMMAAKFRREHPAASPAQIEDMVNDWLAARPGAETEDGDSRPVDLARFR